MLNTRKHNTLSIYALRFFQNTIIHIQYFVSRSTIDEKNYPRSNKRYCHDLTPFIRILRLNSTIEKSAYPQESCANPNILRETLHARSLEVSFIFFATRKYETCTLWPVNKLKIHRRRVQPTKQCYTLKSLFLWQTTKTWLQNIIKIVPRDQICESLKRHISKNMTLKCAI